LECKDNNAADVKRIMPKSSGPVMHLLAIICLFF
jgi:hypothetical protein